jgi:hypothetical protein
MPGIAAPSMTIVSWASARIPGIDGAAATIVAAMMAWAIRMKLDLLVGVMRPSAVHIQGHRRPAQPDSTTMPPVPAEWMR